MPKFQTKQLPDSPDVVAPDGSDVRILLELKGGGMAHFELSPGQTARAVTHRTVEEIWFFIAGQGEMWREKDGVAETVEVYPGVCLTIPLGTRFQFRCTGQDPLEAIGVTMPPWPGKDEALLVEGPWQPTVGGSQEGDASVPPET
ncbi:MAG TPA: cupin domain-containing protein [Terriglobia bacterium]|nr:cupin domain-containing protein [Terriglobia bacterium]